MVLLITLPMTKSEFLGKEDAFIVSVAVAADVPPASVRVLSIDEVFTRAGLSALKRMLLATSVQVRTSIATARGSTFNQNFLNTLLNRNGLPNGTVLVLFADPVSNMTNQNSSSSQAVPSRTLPTIALPIGCAALGSALFIFWLCFRHRSTKISNLNDSNKFFEGAPQATFGSDLQKPEENSSTSESKTLSYIQYGTISNQDISAATSNFCKSKVICSGLRSAIFKGDLKGFPVAIKILEKSTCLNQNETIQKLHILLQYRHAHVLPLLAFSLCESPLYLVFPLMAFALDSILKTDPRYLNASSRLEVACDIAAGLSYLHSPDGELPSLLHRNLKSSNVLIDERGHAKISLPVTQQVMGPNFSGADPAYSDPDHYNIGEATCFSMYLSCVHF